MLTIDPTCPDYAVESIDGYGDRLTSPGLITSVTLHNTIVASNSGGSDIRGTFYSVSSHNLIGIRGSSTSGISHGVNGNLVGTAASPVDPKFVSPSTGNYRLSSTSPARDAGDNSRIPPDLDDLDGDGDTAEPVPFDLDGTPRVLGAVVDMGAYEYQAVMSRRHVFYNNSGFDGKNAEANSNDDSAIAPDKTALLPGQTATFANYTSYSRGINGIMVDIAGLAGAPTAGDFRFRVGNSYNPAAWADAPAPTSITVRPGAGVDGSDRVTLIWADNAIQKRWLQVTVLSDAQGGGLSLAHSDVFYFGNAIGETGNDPNNAIVNATDVVATRYNASGFSQVPLTNVYDFDRSKFVNATDQVIARYNLSGFTPLILLTAPGEAAGNRAGGGAGQVAGDEAGGSGRVGAGTDPTAGKKRPPSSSSIVSPVGSRWSSSAASDRSRAPVKDVGRYRPPDRSSSGTRDILELIDAPPPTPRASRVEENRPKPHDVALTELLDEWYR